MTDWSHETTYNPLRANDRNFYKVEKWSKDDQRIERMPWAGNSLDKAREISPALPPLQLVELVISRRTGWAGQASRSS